MSPAHRFVLCLSLFAGAFSCAYPPWLEARVPLSQEGWHELYAAPSEAAWDTRPSGPRRRRGTSRIMATRAASGPAVSREHARGVGRPQTRVGVIDRSNEGASRNLLRSDTPPHEPQFRQSAAVTSTEAYTGTCVAAMLAASSRTTSPSDEGVGVTNDRCHSRCEARLPLRCRCTYVTLGP